ncbi:MULTISPECIES: restriction endonuclease subunit S [Pseudomonas syringae group]|nr:MULTISPECIES: restriction endonuclease subunit S [Pseudomonas syringae group]
MAAPEILQLQVPEGTCSSSDTAKKWRICRLKHVALINPYLSLSRVRWGEPATFLPMEAVSTDGQVDYSEPEDSKNLVSGFTNFEAGDVILAKITPCFENGKGAVLSDMPTRVGFGSTEFHVLRVNKKAIPNFIYYITKSDLFMRQGEALMIGSAGQKRVSTSYVENFQLALPSLHEQRKIVDFLEEKTSLIAEAISKKEYQIELLEERKQILVQQAVTRGLDPAAPMRNAGIEWIGEIPKHWEVRRSKFTFNQRKELARKNDIQLSATQSYGVIPQDEYEEKVGRKVVKILFNLEKRKHVEVGDFVISMRSFQGGLERAWASGCIRSSYVILKPLPGIDPGYYSYLLKSKRYIAALQATANFIRDGQDLNFENFALVDLPIPPLDEQKEIARYLASWLSKADRGLYLLEQQIIKLKEYKATCQRQLKSDPLPC